MTVPEILAQMEGYKPLFNYGVAGLVLFWLMHKTDRRLESLEKAIHGNSHKLTGLSRALLIELISRETTSITAKVAARQELAKVSPQDAEEYNT